MSEDERDAEAYIAGDLSISMREEREAFLAGRRSCPCRTVTASNGCPDWSSGGFTITHPAPKENDCTHSPQDVCWASSDLYDSGGLVRERSIPKCTLKLKEAP